MCVSNATRFGFGEAWTGPGVAGGSVGAGVGPGLAHATKIATSEARPSARIAPGTRRGFNGGLPVARSGDHAPTEDRAASRFEFITAWLAPVSCSPHGLARPRGNRRTRHRRRDHRL